MRKLVRLGVRDYPRLHRWLVLQDFPGVPYSYDAVAAALDKTLLYGVVNERQGKPDQHLAAMWLGRLDRIQRTAFIDACCAPGQAGRWLSRGIIQQFQREVFERLQLNYLWCEPQRPAARVLAARLGFQNTAGKAEQGLILTKNTLSHTLRTKRRAHNGSEKTNRCQ